MLPEPKVGTAFLLPDAYSLTLTTNCSNPNPLTKTTDVGKPNGTIPDSPESGYVDLSIVPYLDSSHPNNALEDRRNDLINYDHLVKESFIEFYAGGSYFNPIINETDDRTESSATLQKQTRINGKAVNGREGRYITEFSKKSQRSMRNKLCMVNLLMLIKEGNRPLFCSLTVADDIQGFDMAKKVDKAFKKFKKELAKHEEYKKFCGMWKFEFQLNGKPHYHLILWGHPYLCRNWLARTWFKCLYPTKRLRVKNQKHLESGTHVSAIRGQKLKDFKAGQDEIIDAESRFKNKPQALEIAFKKSTNYLTKYITKEESIIPDGWGNKRWWGYINESKFKSYQQKIVIDTTNNPKQHEDITNGAVEVLNNRKRYAVSKSSKLEYVVKRKTEHLPVSQNSLGVWFDSSGNEVGCESDGRKYRPNYQKSFDGHIEIVRCLDEENGLQPYVDQVVEELYRPQLVIDSSGKKSWQDEFVGTLEEVKTLKPLDRTGNSLLSFESDYETSFVLKDSNGNVFCKYKTRCEVPALSLKSEVTHKKNWSYYGVTLEEILELVYPDSTYELVGEYQYTYDSNNQIKETILLCKLIVHPQNLMLKAS